MTTAQHPAEIRSAATLQRDLAQLLDAIDELVGLGSRTSLVDEGLPALARRCRSTLEAEAVLIAVRRAGRPMVFSDADPGLERGELHHQEVLARASLDDVVINGVPGLPEFHVEPQCVLRRHLRRLVTELPRREGARLTLTVCRRAAFASDEVELAMAFASLAGLVLTDGLATDRGRPRAEGTSDVVRRLFAVGLTLHLVLRETEDVALRTVVEEAIDQLDRAILDVRRALFDGPQG